MPSAVPPSILDCIGKTPLVRLQHLDKGLPWPVWVKCEFLNPAGSVKDRIALSIVLDAEARGLLSPGATLIEATAGNTGMGLALVAASRGYRLVCVLPEKMSGDKRQALRLLGAEVIVTANLPVEDPGNFRNVAARMAIENGWFLTDQFCNPANIDAHFQETGKEIWEQSGGELAAFVVGVGTGGSLTGIGRYLKGQKSSLQVVLADPSGSGLGQWVEWQRRHGPGTVPQDLVPGAYKIEGIGSDGPPANFDLSLVDHVETVRDEESFAVQRELLAREGLLVGGSSGTAVAAALRLAARPETSGPVVALLPDSWDRYWSKMTHV